MDVLQILGEAFGIIVGSLLAATCLSWSCWNLFKLVRHPELGVPLILVVVLWVFGGSIVASEFLRMTLLFSIMAAVLLWFVGIEWRRSHPRRHGP
jgi:hypothetical protein